MHIVIGMAADGRAHPAFPGPGRGAVGRAVVGPAGFLEVLAGQLGLSGPLVPPVIRIAAWQAKLEAAAAVKHRFYSASLSADAVSTARLLLSWRDDLVENGWTPIDDQSMGRRVADLAAAERAAPVLPRGRADLLRQVIAAIARGATTDLERVEVMESIALLPPSWQALIDALVRSGVAVSQVPSPGAPGADNDLGRLRRYLVSGDLSPLVGDGSLTMLEGRTAIMAAEAVADWVAHDPDEGRGTVIIVPDGDSTLLDQAFARRGLPMLGASPRSPHRGALQLLSLAFTVTWAPFDPQKLLELLLLPRPPIAPWAARLLATALSREPGIGGPAWANAWAAIEARLVDRNGGTAEPETLADWRAWMEVGVHERAAGIPTTAATAICDRVRRWAIATDGGGRDPLLLCAVGAADALTGALQAIDHSPVTSTQVDALIDLALADGLPDPAHFAREGFIRAVTDPGAVWSAARSLIWWGFTGDVPPLRQPWTTAERKALLAAGCDIEPESRARRRQGSQWERAVHAAEGTLIFVTASLDRGVESASHSLAHRFAPLMRGDSREAIRADAEVLLARDFAALAGRTLPRRRDAGSDLPMSSATWTLPHALATKSAGRSETASSLQDLVECQFRWVLRHVARLRPGGAHVLPEKERLIGNLAHALAQAVFPVGAIPDPNDVHRAATAGIDDLIDRVAAPLRLPGSAAELSFARTRIPNSLASLAALLSKRGFAVVGMEVERELTLGALPVRSRIDLVIRDEGGDEGVVDLKWTSSRTWRRREVEEGRAIQLATYSRLLGPAGGVPAGYYLLRQRELLAETGSVLVAEGLTVERTLDATWDAIMADWKALTGHARSGRGLATGVPGVAEHLPTDLGFPPGEEICRFCDFVNVCRVTRES